MRHELKDELFGEVPQAMRKQLPGFAVKRKTWLRGRARARFDSLLVDEHVSRLQKAFECDVARPADVVIDVVPVEPLPARAEQAGSVHKLRLHSCFSTAEYVSIAFAWCQHYQLRLQRFGGEAIAAVTAIGWCGFELGCCG